ncbi:hypothetical protein HU200_029453 [Digitaria exilis]|uniref:Uncharacterized protein n=1 Tax=Digitaria exilis TaxID=1010633 RepID=A0A835BR99_9POAL|nr:hypothetical protein HU200_029453 [Digitaria exilis]
MEKSDKCDGVPLAIIAIASLLADKPLEDWQMVYKSLIVGDEDKTRKILFLYDIAERYFNELVNRSLIQAVFGKDVTSRFEERYVTSLIRGCRVHDIVLDLIRDLSREENFVTILGKKQLVESSVSVTRSMKGLGLMHGSERKVRRLSIQSDIPLDTIGMPEVVRSLQTADDDLIDVSQLSSFRTCRVLSISEGIGDLKQLDKLLHLRYLEIDGPFEKLPNELGNLKSLQTMITICHPLPLAIFELTQLMCLAAEIDDDSGVIHRETVIKIGNLVCLEELTLTFTRRIGLDEIGVALGKLTRLRVLKIRALSVDASYYKEFMQSLNKLQDIRELRLEYIYRNETTWEPSPESPWMMDPSCFRRLCHLFIYVPVAEAWNTLRHLALLPELRSLVLSAMAGLIGFFVLAIGFQNLRYLTIEGMWVKPKFVQGAMPRLESLHLDVCPGRDLEEINLATLLSLKNVTLEDHCGGFFRGDVEEAEAVVRREVEDHANRPTLRINRNAEIYRLDHDDVKPNKAVRFLVNVWDCWKGDRECDDVEMRYYRWIEEITCDIDCESSSLSDVEYVEVPS